MKKSSSVISIQVDDQRRLILPPEIVERYGLVSGTTARLEQTDTSLNLLVSENTPGRVYVEPTNACNLGCRTCMRNNWDEQLGTMSMQTFERILSGIKSLSPIPNVCFGGLGEPLSNPNIQEMVTRVREIGAEVELITNGTLLSNDVAQWMVELQLKRLWVSIDGATPESYADVRLGDKLPEVLANLKGLYKLRKRTGSTLPKLGIAFVAMKSNLEELPEVVRLGKRLGADQYSISNVLPHTAALCDEILYSASMYDTNQQILQHSAEISLPRMDLNETTIKSLSETMNGRNAIQFGRKELGLGINSCPFMENNSISIRWDGGISPCLPLLHTHTSYLAENQRTSYAHIIGNIQENPLLEIWHGSDYVQLRKRLQEFDFAPCTFCNSCPMAESNLEDCFGNIKPACGGCLWAQGFIQCP